MPLNSQRSAAVIRIRGALRRWYSLSWRCFRRCGGRRAQAGADHSLLRPRLRAVQRPSARPCAPSWRSSWGSRSAFSGGLARCRARRPARGRAPVRRIPAPTRSAPPELVVALGAPALRFYLRHRERCFRSGRCSSTGIDASAGCRHAARPEAIGRSAADRFLGDRREHPRAATRRPARSRSSWASRRSSGSGRRRCRSELAPLARRVKLSGCTT